jgi:hypothetical protein
MNVSVTGLLSGGYRTVFERSWGYCAVFEPWGNIYPKDERRTSSLHRGAQ